MDYKRASADAEGKPDLMNGEAAHEYIKEKIRELPEEETCAVFMIDVDAAAEIRDEFGEQEATESERLAGRLISSMFLGSDIVSRIGRNQYFVFTIWKATEKDAGRKAEAICRNLRSNGDIGPGVILSACVGVYLAKNRGLTFESLFGYAATALYEAKNNGWGSWYVLTNETETRRRIAEEMSKPVSAVAINAFLECLDGGLCLIEMGPEIRLIYASRGFYQIIGKNPESFELPCSIKKVGIHPDYEGDYEQLLQTAAQSGEDFTHIHRVSANGKDWIWRHVNVARVPYPASEYPVMLEISRDISKSVETERRLCESNERLRIAFKQIPNILWEVDIEAKTYNIYDVDDQMCRPDTEIQNFPAAFLERGIIHPDSAENFCVFAENMLKGKNADTGSFIMRDRASGCYGWVSLSYFMMFDANGAPIKAVGVQTKLPSMSGIAPGRFPRRPLPEVVRHHLLIRMKVNLTADYVDEIWIEGRDHTAWTWGRSYSEVLRHRIIRMFKNVDSDGFDDFFAKENLLRDFERGESWATGEFRRVDDGGSIRWMSVAANLLEDPKTHDVYMYACIVDTQERHEWESRIKEGIFRDPVTGLYDFVTSKRVSEYLIQNTEGTECAVSMIRVAAGEEREALSGKEEEEFNKRRKSVAAALSLSLGEDCVLGVYQPDIFYVFFPKVGNRFDIKRRIEDAFAYTRVSMSNLPWMSSIRFVAGTVIEYANLADCSVMAFRAAYLCEVWKTSAMDAAVFPSEDEDWAWAGLRKAGSDKAVAVKEKARKLTKEEQAVAFQCVTVMLKSGSLEESMKSILQCIGQYYRASRTYTLALSDDRQTVTMLHEWIDNGKHSIRYMLSGVHIEQIPLLEKCMSEEKTIFIESPLQIGNLSQGNSKWNFMSYPLTKKGKVAGFLCIENAREHLEEAALLETMLPYIVGEPKRFEMLADRMNVNEHDSLTMLPNLTAYMDMIYTLDSDAYSSMGAASVDVPNFSTLTGNFGFEYGRKMLMFISDTLVNIFGKAYIFRTWDAEFVVLFPNTIWEVFSGRCNRLRTVLQRRYPHQIRIGTAWSGDVFSAKDLVQEAQAVMRSEELESRNHAEAKDSDSLKAIRREFSLQKFMPYFQPKVDMRDGSLIGAEALARGVDAEGKIVPPVYFIETLEEQGTIRDLDLFMLDAVLKQLSEWQRAGRSLVKVSINISRVTLFNPSALASVLAIQSRYPEIPAEQIELEITETGSDMGKSTLASIVDSFRECGLNFELDDFGSGYANISVFSNIEFRTIKLDRSLINDLPSNKITSMLVENIIQICKNFGMNCIAEGVETEQQAEALMKAGCIYGQGYYYSKPLPAQEFESRYLKNSIEG